MLGLLSQVSRGIDARKFSEIMDKMRLIEITATCGQVHPVKLGSGMDLLQDLLESAHTTEEFGRESHFAGEKLDEAARADTNLV